MKFLISVLAVLAFTTSAQADEFYKVTIKRESNDLYKTSEGIYLVTRYCYEYAFNDEAIFRYEGQYGYTKGEIIFDGGSKCDVKEILR